MNLRLQDQYNSIRETNYPKFLNNDLEIDNNWGKPIFGVAFQIDLSEDVKDLLERYQKDLAKLEPDNFFFPDREFMHITFNQVVFWGGEYALGAKGTWEAVADKFTSAFKKLDNKYSLFELTFSQLIGTVGGIIWAATDKDDELEKLRDRFLEELPFPTETTRFIHIIHTTVARYKNKLQNPQVVLNYLDRHQGKIKINVKQIILRNETVFPSMKSEELARITLV